MVATIHTPVRLILTGGFAVAMVIAPSVGVLAGLVAPGASVITASPNPDPGCTITQTPASYALACLPANLPMNSGAPREQDLTQQNQTQNHMR